MSAQKRLNAMRAATIALDAAQAQPAVVQELVRHGLAEQFRLATELLREATQEETQHLMQVSDFLESFRDLHAA